MDEHDPGVYTCDLTINRLFGDGAVAHRCELCPDAAFVGLPIQTYIEPILWMTGDRSPLDT